jgi:hypothetical protein
MKLALTFTSALLWLTTSSAETLGKTLDDSLCNSFKDQNSCTSAVDETDKPCTWCIAGAIPSECMSQEQANLLPSGVFDCINPGKVFQSARGTNYQLRIKGDENSDICDSESKSISGYMDIKGSEYDKAGENKHLFFWMFEKRGGGNETTPVRFQLTVGL